MQSKLTILWLLQVFRTSDWAELEEIEDCSIIQVIKLNRTRSLAAIDLPECLNSNHQGPVKVHYSVKQKITGSTTPP